MEQFLCEARNFKLASLPASAQAGALSGGRASLKGGDRLSIIVLLGGSTGATASFSLKQHNAATGGTSKALAVSNRYYKKVGSAPAAMTMVVPDVAADTYDLSGDFAASEGVVVFEVLSEDLDVNNGFSHVSLDVNASGTAKIAAVVYSLGNTRAKPAYLSVF